MVRIGVCDCVADNLLTLYVYMSTSVTGSRLALSLYSKDRTVPNLRMKISPARQDKSMSGTGWS